MIFSAPRFVVVDDKIQHLEAIVRAFQQLGSPCIGIQFKPEEDLDSNIFRGVRVLFLDLHLVEGIAKTDNRSHYAQIANILEEKISANGGPFILVLWTEHDQYAKELTEYLDNGLDELKPYARPLSVVPLAKRTFINQQDLVSNPTALREAVSEAVVVNPQLAALLGWEVDVLSATGDTLAALLNLVPIGQRTSTAYSNALDVVLSRLASEAVGPSHVEVNHRAAITTALAPILADRIMNQSVSAATMDLWSRAVTRHDDKSLEAIQPIEAGQINRMLHLAIPGSETIRPTDWGSVVKWPYTWSDEELRSKTGLKISELLGGEFLIEKNDRVLCRPCLVRIGAACDYAQNRKGPIIYLLGIEIPENAKRKVDDNGNALKLGAAIWRSPVFVMPDIPQPSRLHVHIRFSVSVLPSATADWFTHYRIREQLLMDLLTSASNYSSRPGIVKL